jgi:lysophospholipase L1-like esterase
MCIGLHELGKLRPSDASPVTICNSKRIFHFTWCSIPPRLPTIPAERAHKDGSGGYRAPRGGFKETNGSLSDQLDTVGRDAFDPQRHARNLLRQMRQVGKPFIVVLGDSITQRVLLPETICGYPVINAGISGSRTSNFIPFAEEMARLDPALIVLALGVNDSSRRLKTAFPASYAALLDSLPKVPTILATIAPVDFNGSDGQTIDPEAVDSVNREIRSTAESRKLPLVELAGLKPFETIDGVHPSVNGNALWLDAVVKGIKSALSCS